MIRRKESHFFGFGFVCCFFKLTLSNSLCRDLEDQGGGRRLFLARWWLARPIRGRLIGSQRLQGMLRQAMVKIQLIYSFIIVFLWSGYAGDSKE